MNIVTRTPKKAIIQVKNFEIENNGFDFVWDEIRTMFPENDFHLHQLDRDEDHSSIYFELVYKEKNNVLSC